MMIFWTNFTVLCPSICVIIIMIIRNRFSVLYPKVCKMMIFRTSFFAHCCVCIVYPNQPKSYYFYFLHNIQLIHDARNATQAVLTREEMRLFWNLMERDVAVPKAAPEAVGKGGKRTSQPRALRLLFYKGRLDLMWEVRQDRQPNQARSCTPRECGFRRAAFFQRAGPQNVYCGCLENLTIACKHFIVCLHFRYWFG